MTLNALQLPTTSAGMEASAAAVKPPDRRRFETDLAALNNSIEEKYAEITKILGRRDSPRGECSSIGELFRLKKEIAQIKSDRQSIRSSNRVPQLSAKMDEFQKQINSVKEEISKIEREDLYYSKDEQKVQAKLKSINDQYMNSKSTSSRHERGLIDQIDKLKRNLKKLAKYHSLRAKKDELVAKFNGFKNDRDRLYKQDGILKSHLASLHRLERNYRKRAFDLNLDLDRLHNEKKELVMNYEQERNNYVQWSRQNRKAKQHQQGERNLSGKAVKRTLSWRNPRHNLNDDNSSDSDGDDYEAFAKEKQICRNLMSFLQNFMSSASAANPPQELDKRQQSSVAQAVTGSKKDDSDEESLSQSSASPKQSIKPLIKHHTKKDKRKNPTQAIPLEPHVLADFDTVSVLPPVNYIEVPIAFEKLKERLSFYEDQMSLTLNFSYSYDEFAYPSSESEMTADSARFSVMTLSEADDSYSSPADRSLSQSSYAFDKQQSSLMKGQYSLEEIDSPKSDVGGSPVKTIQKRLTRSKSSNAKIGAEESYVVSSNKALKNRWSSLKCLSLFPNKKIVKGSTCDEGIEVFLSKDSSANSNVVRF